MNAFLWILSLVYLSAVSGYVVGAVREDDEPNAPTAMRRALGFVALALFVVVIFSVVIYLVQIAT